MHACLTLLVQKNERRVVCATPLQNDARGIRRVNNTAGPFGVSALLRLPDFLEFMPGTGTPQSCREFSNSLRSNSENSLFGIFSGAQQMPMGKTQ